MDFNNSPSGTTQEFKDVLVKERPFWRLTFLEDLLKQFSPAERLTLYGLVIVLGISTLALLAVLNAAYSVAVPAQGGVLTEGETGPARFINPVLSLSQADEDLTELVYSGLTRALPDGSIVPDLASSYDISQDGMTYTFHLRQGATFQDGTPVTSKDVVFTVQAIQNPDIKSPHIADWEGVEVSAPDARTVVFTLPHPYAPFIEDTTLGILPEHVWQNVSAEEFPFSPANTRPIGSGPYRVVSMSTDSTGSPTRYDLAPFSAYTLGAPYISRITFMFYDTEAAMVSAFNAGKIDAVGGVSPEDLSSITRTGSDIVRSTLPRTFGVFFNQNHDAALTDLSARQALDAAVDKQAIVNSVLGGYGVALSGPIPPGITNGIAATPVLFTPKGTAKSASSTPNQTDIAAAKAILQKGGWSFDSTSGTWKKKSGKTSETLSLTLATADEPELVATADIVVADWQALGVKVSVQVYPLSQFNNTVLRPRQYDAVLFGEVVGRSLDLFAFWDSTERNDPGLNLAMYANATVDSLLSQARATTDPAQRDKLDAQFSTDIAKDEPAVFLYAPQFIYLVPRSLQGVQLGALTTPAERFLNVYQWYTETENVWSIFAK